MKISLLSVSVGDQDAALAFYAEKLGFVKTHDMSMADTCGNLIQIYEETG